jgi:NAD(P)-dependent dehydrogenase (short-subunit alcohol dehydrogenase family)
MTTSSSGLYGNFGQANYGAAKAGVVGLMNVLAQEGRKNDIRVNTLSPTAATRMTEDLIPPDMLSLMTPESITPGLLYLVSDDAPTRTTLCAGAGAFAVARIVESEGAYFPEAERTPEAIAARFSEIADTAGARALDSALQQTDKFVRMAAEAEGISLGAPNREKTP